MKRREIAVNPWWTLSVLCLSLVMVVLGNTVLNVALPTLIRDLGATSTQLQWMVDSYALVFAGLLLTAGALGDRFGRKGALIIGLVIFGGASLASAFATSPNHLIATRAIMGLASALVMPATLSILVSVFTPERRGRAIAIWAGFAGVGGAIGPIAGGWLLEHFYWGSVFLLTSPSSPLRSSRVAGSFRDRAIRTSPSLIPSERASRSWDSGHSSTESSKVRTTDGPIRKW